MIRKGKTFAARKSTPTQRRAPPNLRMRVLAGFRALGHGVDERTARQRAQAFYRSSGAAWARCLT